MARPKLTSPDQPPLLYALFWLYEAASSLKLAVVLILSAAFTFGLGTVVESAYGLTAAQAGVYQSWWFNLLLGMLAMTIFCAAAIRFPWKRHQTGFVITHIGLLTLLFGTMLSRLYGIDAQIPIFESQSGHVAYEDGNHFELAIHQLNGHGNRDHGEQQHQVVSIPFPAGPFNWNEYYDLFPFNKKGEEVGDTPWQQLSFVPWKLFRVMSGVVFRNARQLAVGDVLYDKDGVKLEILNYYSDSREVDAPSVTIRMSSPSAKRMNEDGKMEDGPVRWSPLRLTVRAARGGNTARHRFGVGQRQRMGGGSVLFWMSGSEAQTSAFLSCEPQGPLGTKGQVVLLIDGEQIRFLAEDKLGQGRFPLGDTGMEAEVVKFYKNATLRKDSNPEKMELVESEDDSKNPTVEIHIYKDSEQSDRLVLFADMPEFSVQAYDSSVFGDYWFDHGEKTAMELMQKGGGSRIDIIQGQDELLYYRYWNRKQVVVAAEFPIDGSEEEAVNAFKMPIAQLKMYVSEFVPADKAGRQTLPITHDHKKVAAQKRPAAHVRLTVDDEREEFWLAGMPSEPGDRKTLASEMKTVTSDNKLVTTTLPPNGLDIGFRIQLNEFDRRLDPGTSQAAHYSSTVDFLDRDRENVIMTASLDGSGVANVPLADLHAANSIALASDGALFWADPSKQAIYRTDLKGVARPIVENLRFAPGALAVAGGKLYWSDSHSRSIRRVDLDGRDAKTIVADAGKPVAIAVDANRIYWADKAGGGIRRAKLDGSAVENLIEVDRPTGLALDRNKKRIYWTNGSGGEIWRGDYDGSNRKVLVSRDGDANLAHITLDADGEYIYWTDTGRNAIRRAESDGSNVVDLVADLDRPVGLALDIEADRIYWTQSAAFHRDVWITMNAPVEFSDPTSGKSYRLFQESFGGPWRPGEPVFERYVDASSDRDEMYMSVLTVNHDPGRGIRNIGLLFVTAGIFTMFYMRAYFFKPTPNPPNAAAAKADNKKNDQPSLAEANLS